MFGQARNGPVGGHADQIEDAIAGNLRRGDCRDARKLARHLPLAELGAAQVEKHPEHALIVEDGGVGDTLAVEIRPDEPARTRHGVERRLRRERVVSVVAQNRGRCIAARHEQVEVAVGVDVGGPYAVQRTGSEIRRKLRRSRGGCKRALVRLPENLHPPAAGNDEIVAEVVVEIGGGHAVGAESAG
jgi:hypothetical protein